MKDMLAMLGAIQNGGGVMIGFVWLALELRNLRAEFRLHEKIYHGQETQDGS